jgi:hypothetical protein
MLSVLVKFSQGDYHMSKQKVHEQRAGIGAPSLRSIQAPSGASLRCDFQQLPIAYNQPSTI